MIGGRVAPWAEAWDTNPHPAKDTPRPEPPTTMVPGAASYACCPCPGADSPRCCRHGEFLDARNARYRSAATQAPEVSGVRGRRRRWLINLITAQRTREAEG